MKTELTWSDPSKSNKYVKPWIFTGKRRQRAIWTRSMLFTTTLPFVTIRSQASALWAKKICRRCEATIPAIHLASP